MDDDNAEILKTELASFESDISSMGQRLSPRRSSRCRAGGKFSYSAEATLLRIYGADRVMVGDDNDAAAQETGKGISYRSVDAGFRTTLGYERCDGVGIRAAYFRQSNDADLVATTIPGDNDTVEGKSGETRFETFDLA